MTAIRLVQARKRDASSANLMRRKSANWTLLLLCICLSCLRAAGRARATSSEPGKDVQADPGRCVAAAAAADDDKTIDVCGSLIDNDKTERADRVRALTARAGAYRRKQMIDRAIA